MTTIAISHTWPDIKNAEYEVLQRLLNAAELLSIPVIVVDRSGVILWFTRGVSAITGQTLRSDQVDFLISLHFESPKIIDTYSYYALWQPVDFYAQFGYEATIRSLMSHDDLISCDSDIADAHGLNLLEASGRSVQTPLPRMFHTLPQPFLEPQIDKDARVFYVGVNWERLGRPKGRFHDTLLALANKNLVDIYGPELLLGVAPWGDFAGYQGELPFDGEAIKFALNRAGICLALSSQPHVETGIMSNRLFEGLAGGAAVICNNNPFVVKHFSDEVYIVDSDRGEEALAMQVIQIVHKIRSDPAAAREKVLRAQKIMREKFALERNLQALIGAHDERITTFRRENLIATSVTVIADFRGTDLSGLEDLAESLRHQEETTVVLHVLCDSAAKALAADRITSGGSLTAVHITPSLSISQPARLDGLQPFKTRRGRTVAEILARQETRYFAFASPGVTFFSRHFARLACTLEREAGSRAATALPVITSKAADGTLTRRLDGVPDGEASLLAVELEIRDASRFLFDARLAQSLPRHLFELLDGAEHLFFGARAVLAGPIAQTFQPSLDRNLHLEALLRPIREQERQAIKDYLRFNPAWLRAAARTGSATEPTSSAPSLAATGVEFPLIKPNQRYVTKDGGDGVMFLAAGFSEPEESGTWCLKRGVIDFSLPDVTQIEFSSFVLRCELLGRASQQTGRPQNLTFVLNGMTIAYTATTGFDQTLLIALPISKLPNGNRFRLEMIPDHAEPVIGSDAEVLDPRLLSFRLASFVVEQTACFDAPRIALGETMLLNMHAIGRKAVAQGFYDPEPEIIWIAGTRGRLQFYIESVADGGRLSFEVSTRNSEKGEPQRLAVTMNGKDLGEQVLQPGASHCTFEFETSLASGDLVDISLRLSHAEPVYDASHEISDARLLGLALRSVTISTKETSPRLGHEVALKLPT